MSNIEIHRHTDKTLRIFDQPKLIIHRQQPNQLRDNNFFTTFQFHRAKFNQVTPEALT